MFTLSNTSQQKLDTCHEDLILIIKESIKTSLVDFGVSEGERSLKTQQEYFAQGLSRCDGVTNKSKHQNKPSLAVDIYAYYNGAAHWDDLHLAYLGGHIIATADRLYREGRVTHKLRWGGNWDMDGVIVLDQRLKDLPHFELVT